MSEPIIYIDSYAYVGERGPIDTEDSWSTETLLLEMEHTGIHAALITHSIAKEFDPAYGNGLLKKELAKSERLIPCWVLMPDQCGEMAPGPQIVREMLEENIRAARLCPTTHHFLLDKHTCGEMLDALEAEKIPLCVEHSEVDYPALAWLCESYPELPVLFQQNEWVDVRKFVPIMDRCANLCTEFSTNQSNYAIERSIERWGADRLLLGTEALFKSPGAAKSFVDYSDISDSDRRLIAGGNIARLLKLPELPELYAENPDEGTILKAVKAGKPLDILVIDSHTHINPPGVMGVGHHPQPNGDVEGMIARNRRMGIDTFCPMSWLGIWTGTEDGNQVCVEAREKYPDDVVPYATLNPMYCEDFPAAIRHAHEVQGCLGIKPYFPRTHIPYNSPLWEPWLSYGNEHSLFCLLHPSNNFSVEALEIAEKYPEVTFILAHTGGSYDAARVHIDIAAARPNVFLEITLTPVTYRVIEYMVREVGADRVLFGTDAPMRDPIPQFGWMGYSHCSDEELTLMFGKNMEGIIARCSL